MNRELGGLRGKRRNRFDTCRIAGIAHSLDGRKTTVVELIKVRFEFKTVTCVGIVCDALPQMINLRFLETATAQGTHSGFEAFASDLLLGILVEGQEKLEQGLNVPKSCLCDVLNLNQDLVLPHERFECTFPVVDVDESLFMRVNL